MLLIFFPVNKKKNGVHVSKIMCISIESMRNTVMPREKEVNPHKK